MLSTGEVLHLFPVSSYKITRHYSAKGLKLAIDLLIGMVVLFGKRCFKILCLLQSGWVFFNEATQQYSYVGQSTHLSHILL